MVKTPSRSELAAALKLHFRILTFQASREELANLNATHLAVGLVWTWVVGIGRWWDDPGANLILHLGLGSVAYVFVLSLVLWLFALPMRPRNLTYFRTLTYVTLTAPPALLYAIPVERWYGVYTAAELNVWFLAIVAIWRLALFCRFLCVGAELPAGRSAMAVLLPVMLTIVALTMLNLERGVFEIMGGLRQPTAADKAFAYLILLSALCMYGSIIAVPSYIAVAIYARMEKARAASAALTSGEEEFSDVAPQPEMGDGN
jgi:hypothetical protein